jgi:uncharacterized LabA/DUF88 family protein
MPPIDDRLKIAVFIDFDNVEIGVKNTIGGQFDIGVVLEAIKERGEIVTKIAYSDWKRVGEHSRQLTQHAIRMVQRNVTPGGDKNGADITMALDALEMAFTHNHINAFVIVGGDSDFMSLVEKLKQYDRKVIVVGGRQFTSATMQKNCHEFIAYENLVGASRPARQPGRGARRGAAASSIDKVLPLVRRALKVLSEREVTPQLGLLKSTLLQLDSTFSEREYGAGSFRDFMEKVAKAGAVTLKQAGRSLLVEALEDGDAEEFEEGDSAVSVTPQSDEGDAAPPVTMSATEGIRALEGALAAGTPRWPMYVRQMKQYLKMAIEDFDERRYGFTTPVDLLRAAQKEGLVRLERDRQGVMRVFAGGGPDEAAAAEVTAVEGELADQAVAATDQAEAIEAAAATEPPTDDTQPAVVQPVDHEEPHDSQAQFMAAIDRSLKPVSTRARKSTRGRATKAAPRVASDTAPDIAPRAAKPRARQPARKKAEAK